MIVIWESGVGVDEVGGGGRRILIVIWDGGVGGGWVCVGGRRIWIGIGR